MTTAFRNSIGRLAVAATAVVVTVSSASVFVATSAGAATATSQHASTPHIPSNGSSATVPSAPLSPAASVNGANGANVSWSAPSSDGGSAVTGYIVTSPQNPSVNDHVSASTTSVSLAGLVANTSTTFSIVAVNAIGNSAPANTNPIVTSSSAAACSLYWTGAVSSAWENTGNWSSTDGGSSAGRLPSSSDVVCFSTSPVTSDVTLSSQTTVQGIQWAAAGAVTPHLTVAWNGGLNVTNDPASAVANLSDNGPITLGTQTALRTDTLTTGGVPVISGPGSIIVNPGGTGTLGGKWPTLTNGATFINQGDVTLPSGATLYFNQHSVLDNLGTFHMGDNTDLCDADSTGSYTLNGFGATFDIDGASINARAHTHFSNQGTVNVNSGGFTLYKGIATNIPDAGPWNLATGTNLTVDAARSFSSSTLVSGHGTLVVNAPVSAGPNSVSSSLDVEAPLTLTGNASLSVYNLTINSSITGGSLTDSVSLTIPRSATPTLDGTTVTNLGSGSIGDGAQVLFLNNARLANSGNLSLGNGSTCHSTDGTSSFTNSGTVSVASGAANINIPATNSGTFDIGYFSLNVNGGLTETSSAVTKVSINNSGFGTLNTGVGATLAGSVLVTVDPTLTFPGVSASFNVVTASGATNTTTASTPGVISLSTINASGTTVTLYTAPQITSASSTTFVVNAAGHFQVTADGLGTISYDETGTLPTGVTFNKTTGLLSGTPTQHGVFPITISATNAKGTATQSFTLTVNEAPAITSASATTFVVGSSGTFTVTSTGFLPATYSESGTLPSGVTFNATTGVLSGTPAAGTSGVYHVTFTATNATGTSNQSFTLTVNQAPAITSANKITFTVGSSGTFTVTATGFPTPTLSETGTLPSGVTFNATTGVLSGTPAAGTGGTYVISFRATNVVSAATQSFTLTVNQAPAITSAASAVFVVSTANTFTVTATGFPTPTYSETGTLPSGVTFNSTTGVLSGTPAAGTNGVYTITITATNAAGTTTQTFKLTIAPCITSANNTTFAAGTLGTFTVTSTGISSPVYSETGALPSGVTLSSTGILSGTPAAGTGGTYVITLKATNGTLTATQTFTLTISQGPVITSANTVTYTTAVAGTFTVTATGFPAPTYSETGALPSGVTLNATTGVLSGTPAAGSGGTYVITLTATNPSGVANQTFTLIVRQAPAITSAATTTFTTSVAGTFTVTTTGYATAKLTVTGTLPSGVTFVDNGNGTATLSGTPAAGTGGSYSLQISAANAVSTVKQTFTLVVIQPPVITSANSVTFATGTASTFKVTATGYLAPTFTETGTLPSGVTLNATTGVLSGTPAATAGGVYVITLTATNAAGTSTQTFTLTVNQPPVITSANNTTFIVGTATTFKVTSTGYVLPTLVETGNLPTGVTFVDNGKGTANLAGTAAAGTGGIYTFTITATNEAGVANQTFTLTVNQLPVYTSSATTTFNAGVAGTFTVTTQAYPNAKYTESGALPNGIIFADKGNGTATFSGTPGFHSGGSYTITISATNVVGTTKQTFTLLVYQAPAITSANTKTFTTGTAGTFTVTATGYPVPTYTETGALPKGVTLTSAGVLAGTPAAGTGGVYPITITATNSLGTATQSFSLIVNQPPAFTSAATTTFAVGTAGHFTVTTSGYPNSSYTYTGTLPSGVILVDNGDGTASFSGTPRAGFGGSYTITITAKNAAGTATQTFVLIVNQAPVFTSASSTTFTVATAGTFTVTGTGYPAPTFTESGTLPTGVTYSAGKFSGTPAANTGGVYHVTLTATNAFGTATQNFTLTVNQAPSFTSAASTTFTVGTAGHFTVTTFAVPNATYTESGVLPSGVTFVDNGDGTATIAGTPAIGYGKVYTLTLTAKNAVASVTQTFTLTVNEAPSITSVALTTFTVGTAGTFSVVSTGYPLPTFSETGALPSGVTLNASTGKLAGTPAAGSGGLYSITITATNVYGTSTQTFVLTVNQGPTFTSAATTTFKVGTAGTYKVTTNGVPNATYSYTGTLPSGVVLVDNGDGSASFSGTPAAGFGGSYTITITATNLIATVTQTFTLVVNQAPVITSANTTTFTTGTAGTFTVTGTGYPAPTFTETGALPTGVTFSAGKLAGTPAAGTGGSYTITITATSGALTSTQTFVLIVNQASAFTSATSASFTAGTSSSFIVKTSGYPIGSLWETGVLPRGLSFVDNGDGTATLAGTPANGSGGTYALTFTLLVGTTKLTQTFTLTINENPSITSGNSTTFVVGSSNTFTASAYGFPGATFSETGTLPSGVTFSAAGVLSGTPAAGTAGSYTITIKAANAFKSYTQTFILVVTTTKVTFTTTVTATFTVGTASSFTITQGSGKGNLTETGTLPGGVTWKDNGNGTATLSGTPTVGSGGFYTITVTYTYLTTVVTETFTIYVNEGPAVTSATTTTFTVGTSSSFTFTASGFPAPTFTFTGTMPLGLNFNTTTGVIYGTPAPGAGGSYSWTITIKNSIKTITQTFVLIVDQAPALTSATSATFAVGTAGTYTFTATGFPAPTFSEQGALPSGVTFNSTTGVLSGTPAAGTGGVYVIKVTLTNVVTTITITFTFNVTQTPAVTSANKATFTVGTYQSVTVTASGNPNAAYTLAGTLPSGVTFVDNGDGTGSFFGTPGPGAGGVYSVTITAKSSVGTTTQTFTITVNAAPQFSPSQLLTTNFTVGTAGTFTFAARAYATATWSEVGALPTGVTLNATTGVLSGTPAAGTGGTYVITVTATNTTGSASITFTLVVAQAPVITSASTTTFTVGQSGSFTLTASGAPNPTYTYTGTLPSGVVLVDNRDGSASFSGTPSAGFGGNYTITITVTSTSGTATQTFTLVVLQAPAFSSGAGATFTVGTAGTTTLTSTGNPKATFTETGNLPSGVTFVDNGNGTATFAGTPAAGTGGVYSVTVTATNVLGAVSETFSITVQQAPTITSAISVTTTVGTAVNFTTTASGLPGASWTSTGTLPSGVTFVDNGDGTGSLFGTPGINSGASYTLTFTAKNSIGTATQTFTLVVRQPAVITSGAGTTFTTGTAGTFTVTTTGFPANTITETGNLPSGVTFVDNGNGTATLAGTAAAGTGGTYSFTVTATNALGSATQTFVLTVIQAPTFTSANTTSFTVGAAGNFTVSLQGFPALYMTAAGVLPGGVTFVDNANGTGSFVGTPQAGSGGSYAVTITAVNTVGTATQTFTLVVDQPLAFTSAAASTFTVGTAGTYTIATSGFPAATYAETGNLPSGVTLNATTGVLSGTPAAGTGGVYSFTVTATNLMGSVTQTFTLTVNQVPVITSANSVTFAQGTSNTFTVTATAFPAATYSETGTLPSGVTLNATTGVLSGTPAAGTGGSYALSIKATNAAGTFTQSFTLVVTQAPVITSANAVSFTTGVAGTFSVTSTGYPAGAVSESGVLPSGVTFVDNGNGTATLAGTAAAGHGGTYVITITVTNSVSSVHQTFTLTVNDAPAFTSANATTFTVGTTGTFSVATTGFPTPTYSATGVLPSAVTFNAATGTFAGTPATGTDGDYVVTVTATNSVSSVNQTFTLSIVG